MLTSPRSEPPPCGRKKRPRPSPRLQVEARLEIEGGSLDTCPHQPNCIIILYVVSMPFIVVCVFVVLALSKMPASARALKRQHDRCTTCCRVARSSRKTICSLSRGSSQSHASHTHPSTTRTHSNHIHALGQGSQQTSKPTEHTAPPPPLHHTKQATCRPLRPPRRPRRS
jgi:hypothetical protein